jgi:hypothetical protein
LIAGGSIVIIFFMALGLPVQVALCFGMPVSAIGLIFTVYTAFRAGSSR